MIETQITGHLLRDGSQVLALMPSAHFRWDDAEAAASPQIIARRGQSEVQYNIGGTIDVVRTQVTFECYASRTLEAIHLAAAVAAEMGMLRGGEVFYTTLRGMPDRGFHRETDRYRRDVEFEIVHR